MAKYWLTDKQCEVVDRCVQLHGGNGYMREYLIARMYEDSRVQRIYAGANDEIHHRQDALTTTRSTYLGGTVDPAPLARRCSRDDQPPGPLYLLTLH